MPHWTLEQMAEQVDRLRHLSRETEWVEFKQNQAEPEAIGRYIAALANTAALAAQPLGYIVWGIADSSHDLVGTAFDPFAARIGNELLEGWLNRLLDPKIAFSFSQATIAGKQVVVLEVPCAPSRPVQFKGEAFIRVGSYQKKLKDQPERERALWRSFDRVSYEEQIAAECDSDHVLNLLDYPAYFDILKLPLPEGRVGILDALKRESFIKPGISGEWSITNLGALLFARRLTDFPRLGRKAARVVQYGGNDRVRTWKEQVSTKGYACGFDGIIQFVNGLLPSNEVIGAAASTRSSIKSSSFSCPRRSSRLPGKTRG